MDEDPEQPVDAADRFHAVERSADRAPDRAQDHRRDQRDEHTEHGWDVDQLLHLSRVLVVEPEYQQQGAEKEDLGRQGLDHASLEAEEQRDDDQEAYGDVDEQPACIVEMGSWG